MPKTVLSSVGSEAPGDLEASVTIQNDKTEDNRIDQLETDNENLQQAEMFK